MRRMLARAGIVAVVMAGTVVMTGGTPAYAWYYGYLVTTVYYNNAQHSQVVGIYYVGNCPHAPNSGSQTKYFTTNTSSCIIQ